MKKLPSMTADQNMGTCFGYGQFHLVSTDKSHHLMDLLIVVNLRQTLNTLLQFRLPGDSLLQGQ